MFISESKYLEAREHLSNLISEAMEAPLDPPKPEPKKRFHRPEFASEIIAVGSDWHVGKKTASYNLDIFNKRARQYGAHLVQLCKEVRPLVFHFAPIGDIVDGADIYPGQVHHIEVPEVQQKFIAANAIAEILRDLSPHVPLIEVPCIVGNHGRMGRKGEGHPLSNWDYLVYRYAQALTVNLKNVRWKIALDTKDTGEAWYLIHKVSGRPVLFMHGDALSGSGTPNAILAAATKWAHSMEEPWEIAMLGHFHWAYDMELPGGRRVLGNSTLVSGDDFTLRVIKTKTTISQKVIQVPVSRQRPLIVHNVPLD